jgi:ATP synthase protein I
MPDNNLDQDSKKGFQLAARVGIEFISGLFVGVLLGYAFDHYFETKPWGMIIFILLGAGSGFLNIFRLVLNKQSKVKLDSIKQERSTDD